MELDQIVRDFAQAMMDVDATHPQAVNQRTKAPYQAGLGPHPETQTVALVVDRMASTHPDRYSDHELGVAYPDEPRQKCDLCFGTAPNWSWALEIKPIRMLGDNGKPNDNLPTHVLSPYPKHRSALTDCDKLSQSGLGDRRAILIYGYEADEYPVMELIDAFVHLAEARVELGLMALSRFAGLIHPVHRHGVVAAWELVD